MPLPTWLPEGSAENQSELSQLPSTLPGHSTYECDPFMLTSPVAVVAL